MNCYNIRSHVRIVVKESLNIQWQEENSGEKVGICVEAYGDAFKDKKSRHYKAHQSLETFWADYRKGGSKYGSNNKPTNGQYNRALYDSMVFAGFSNDQAAYIAFRAYDQQRSYGMNNTDRVPNVPGRMPQKK